MEAKGAPITSSSDISETEESEESREPLVSTTVHFKGAPLDMQPEELFLALEGQGYGHGM